MSRKLFVGGNWKLNPTTQAQVKSLVESLNGGSWTDAVGKEPLFLLAAHLEDLTSFSFFSSFIEPSEVVVAPSAIHLGLVRSLAKKDIGVAGQNCYVEPSGAFTGETSAASLKDLEIDWVILGHSERRNVFGESSEV